jgi:calcineurin-like phosphoesterase
MSYRILFLGDVVGRPGRDALKRDLPALIQKWKPLFVIVNGENAAGGVGITSDIADAMFDLGVDAITLGNHAFNKREIFPYLNGTKPIIRPINMPAENPGRGSVEVTKDGITLLVVNLSGRVFMDPYDDPFRMIDSVLEGGRATAVVGTHTHVPTADERILPNGTAAITDVGMTGPYDSVLGMNKSVVLSKFLTGMSVRFEVAEAPGVISGVVIDVERLSGRATAIERVRT